MVYREFLARLKQNKIAATYLFVGEEEFLIDEALKELKKKWGGEVSSFYADEADVNSLVAGAKTLPLFSSKKLIVLKGIAKLNPQSIKTLVDYVENPSKFTCLVLIASEVKKGSPLYQTVHKRGEIVDFKPLNKNETVYWITERFRGFQKRIDSSLARNIRENIGGNLQQLNKTIERLVSYSGSRREITSADVDALIVRTYTPAGFELTDAVGEKDTKKALELFSDLSDSGKSETELIGLIAWHLRRVEKVKGLVEQGKQKEVSRGLNIPDYFVKRFMAQADKFDKKEIKTGFELLLQADTRIKTGYLPPRIIMETLLVKLCRNTPKNLQKTLATSG